MKSLTLFTAIILAVCTATAQYSWQWAITEGSTDNEYITAIACDIEGNIYASGAFRDTLVFFGETLISSGYDDIFVASFDSKGNLIWVRKGGGTLEDVPRDICVKNGYVYVTGGFNGQATFEDDTLVTIGFRDVFLLKYDKEGALQWAASGGSVTDDAGNSVTVDEDGNIFITGDINNAANFGDHSVNYYGFTDIFIASYDESGACQWATSAGGPIYDYGSSIEVKGNHLFIGGSFNDVAVFDTATVSSVDFVDIFIAHYLSDGSFVEIVSAGGTGNESINCLALDNEMNVYATGWFLQNITIGDNTFNSKGGNDIFLTKFEPGTGFTWAQSFGGTENDEAMSIFRVDKDHLIFSGSFEDEISFGSDQLISDGYDDGFLAKFDKNGNFDWVFQAGGSGGITGRTCTADPEMNYYFAGDFLEELIIGDSVFFPTGNYDLFLAQLAEETFINEANNHSLFNIYLSPNPFSTSTTLEYNLNTPQTVTINFYNQFGKLVDRIEQKQPAGKQQVVWTPDLPGGIYYFRLEAAGRQISSGKVVLVR